jgi:PAS domain S-box-containing protein
MTTGRPGRAGGYLVALGAVAVATIVRFLLQPLLGDHLQFITYFGAVFVTAALGGFRPTAISVVLGAGLAWYFFFPPAGSASLADPAAAAGLVLFTVIGLGMGWLGESRLRGFARARQAAVEAERQEKLAEEEQATYRALAELSPDAILVVADGRFVYANAAAAGLLGADRPEQLLGQSPMEFVQREFHEALLGRTRSIIEQGAAPPMVDYTCRRLDGTLVDVEVASGPVSWRGRPAVQAVGRDTTERRRAERQARAAEARLAAIVMSSSDAIVSKTLEGVVTSWNTAAERVFGYTAEEMIGQPIFRLIPPEHHEAEVDLLARVRQGESVEFSETERIRKDGTRIWISLSVSPVLDHTGAIIGAASIKRDITERRRLDERLRSAQRLQAVGQLAGGIAHEANNQMSVVLGGAHFLLRRSDLPEQARADVEHIRQAAERTAAITQQLLAFSRRQMMQLQDVSLNQVVEAIGPVLRRSLSERHELVVSLGPSVGVVHADPRQLEQVLLNLTLNARDAMPSGGRLTIQTAEREPSPSEAEDLGTRTGRFAVLTVSDTGTGITADTLAHIFEPFFTTKSVGQGTGLGLSVVDGIVSQIGGRIRVHSAPGRGSTFTLFFPLGTRASAKGAGPDNGPPAARAGTRVLVVEDDDGVRAMTSRALAEAGYAVQEAVNGHEALELVRGDPWGFDLVLTDLGMPVLDGYELARRVEETRADLPLVFMTGYADERGDGSGGGPGRRLIHKPFSPELLVRVVGEALTSRRRSGEQAIPRALEPS